MKNRASQPIGDPFMFATTHNAIMLQSRELVLGIGANSRYDEAALLWLVLVDQRAICGREHIERSLNI